MPISENITDFGSFWANLHDLIDKISETTPFSLSTFHGISDGTVEVYFFKLFEDLVYRGFVLKSVVIKNGPKSVSNFSNRLRVFLSGSSRTH